MNTSAILTYIEKMHITQLFWYLCAIALNNAMLNTNPGLIIKLSKIKDSSEPYNHPLFELM